MRTAFGALVTAAVIAVTLGSSAPADASAERDAIIAKRIAQEAMERANAARDRTVNLRRNVSAQPLPSIRTGRTDTLKLTSSGGVNGFGTGWGPWYYRLAPAYCCGALVESNAPLVEHFVGGPGRPGGLGVRSRAPSGPDAGAKVYARDAEDRYDLALDHFRQSKPMLHSESPFPLYVETAARADIVLNPGGGRSDLLGPGNGAPQVRTVGDGAPVGEVVVMGPSPLVVNPHEGWISFPDLPAVPSSAPVGALARVGDTLQFRTSTGWVPLTP